MKHPIFRFCILYSLILLILVTVSLHAAVIEVSEIDVLGGRWNQDDTVRVNGNIVLTSDSTLIIEPGVRVEFTGPFNFEIHGKLIADGEGDSIKTVIFTALQPDIDSLRWRGLRFINADRDCKLSFCRIEYSWARGPWPESCGGGIYIEGSTPTIYRCEILRNRAEGEGGGIYGWSTTAIIKNSLIVLNRSERFGGGLFIAYSQPQLVNCTVAYNTASGWGGGIFVGTRGEPTIINCIVSNNIQELEVGGQDLTIFDDAYADDIARAQSSAPVVTFSSITNNPTIIDPFRGTGNITGNPFFMVVPPADAPYNFHLQPRSPCIDAGNPQMNASLEKDIFVNRINMGAYGGTEDAQLSLPVIFISEAEANPDIPINYGSVRTNTTDSGDLTIENRGHYRLSVEMIEFTSPEVFSTDSVDTDEGIKPSYAAAPIEPGESVKVKIIFKPDSLREYRDTLFVVSDDTSSVPFIRLLGTGIDPIASLAGFSIDTTYIDTTFIDTIVGVDTTFYDTTITVININTVINRVIDFGEFKLGGDTVIQVAVYNLGRSSLRITEANVNGDNFYASTGGGTIVVDARDTTVIDSGIVTLSFRPEFAEEYSGRISIRTNDVGINVEVLGKGIGPKLVMEVENDSLFLSENSLFMGYVYHGGDVATDTIYFKNSGDSTSVLTINSIVVTNQAFSVTIPDSSISGRDTSFFLVHFDPPQADRDYSGQLTVNSNYPVSYTLDLTGRGMAEPGKYMYGHVSGEWLWEEGQDNYIILDSVYIPQERQLKIASGANVLFEPGAFLQADGALRAVGTPVDDSAFPPDTSGLIYFLPRNSSGTDSARWQGVFLSRDDNSRLAYCVIRGSISGLHITESSPLIQFSEISGNGDREIDASNHDGGGVYLENSGARLRGCVIENNGARFGGGIYVLNSIPEITNCTIRNNRAWEGGGVYLRFQAAALMQNNLIYDNIATVSGGGISIYEQSQPHIINCNIVDNDGGGGIYASIWSVPRLVNSILWNNEGAALTIVNNANALVSYCNIDTVFRGESNDTLDPGFDPLAPGMYYLSDSSKMIDRGNPDPVYRDWFRPPSLGTDRNDIGAYGGPLGGTWRNPTVDITVFQNSAFPRWLDIYVTSLDSLDDIPTCLIELGVLQTAVISLERLDEFSRSFRGEYEMSREGTLFIGVQALLSADTLKVGRTFDVTLVEPDEGGRIYISGVDGIIDIPSGLGHDEMTVISSVSLVPPKPVIDRLFITPQFSISGLTLTEEVELSVEVEKGLWSESDMDHVGLYQRVNDGWVRLDGGYSDSRVTGRIRGSGTFAAAWDKAFTGSSRSLPEAHELLRAFPNPFNQSVSIEFTLAQANRIRLVLYDINGRIVAQATEGFFTRGRHVTVWEGRDINNKTVASGLYFARLEGTDLSRTVKLLLVR